ncbi:MAG: hypothetical protein J6K20_00170 [Thermoguttaceae bacterium]|nr:hypothetical protein [Thermoguttaceae bacterium]
MLSEAIKCQEKSFSLLWEKGGDVPDEKWLPLYQATYLVDVRITQAQEYGVERLIDEGRGSVVESLKLQAKWNYLTLVNALGK